MCIRDRVTCLLHIISDVTRVRHAQGTTLSILRAFVACAAAVQTAVLALFGALQYTVAEDKRAVRCRPIKQKRLNLPQLLIKTYLRLSTFLPFVQKIYRKSYLRENF